MALVDLPVVAGGGWNSIGAFPANQNDGNDLTYQWWPGNAAGIHNNAYDSSLIPNGADISDLTVFGNWGAGSAPATVACSVVLGAGSFTLGVINDVASYAFGAIPRPGGGPWTKTDVGLLSIQFASLATGNGNAQRLKSSTLRVTYVLGGTMFVALIH